MVDTPTELDSSAVVRLTVVLGNIVGACVILSVDEDDIVIVCVALALDVVSLSGMSGGTGTVDDALTVL